MKPEYQFARLECEHNPKIVLRSAQNADTIVKSADCQVQEKSENKKKPLVHSSRQNLFNSSGSAWNFIQKSRF